MQNQTQPKKQYENPKVYGECYSLYTMLISNHKLLNKSIRVVLLEQQIYPSILNSMRKILEIHCGKKNFTAMFIDSKVIEIKTEIEIIKSHLSFLLESKYISQGFYMQAYKKAEQVSMQLSGWNKFLQQDEQK